MGNYINIIEQRIKLKKLLVKPGLTVYSVDDGTIMDLNGPGSCYPKYLFTFKRGIRIKVNINTEFAKACYRC